MTMKAKQCGFDRGTQPIDIFACSSSLEGSSENSIFLIRLR